MSDFLDRLKQEEKELQDKLNKLGMFLHTDKLKDLSRANELLLRKQYSHMNAYLNILIIRIELLEK